MDSIHVSLPLAIPHLLVYRHSPHIANWQCLPFSPSPFWMVPKSTVTLQNKQKIKFETVLTDWTKTQKSRKLISLQLTFN